MAAIGGARRTRRSGRSILPCARPSPGPRRKGRLPADAPRGIPRAAGYCAFSRTGWTNIATILPIAPAVLGWMPVSPPIGTGPARKRDLRQTHLPATLSAVRLGELAILFHPAELCSCYGLAIRRDSPLRNTLVVGYTDGIIGYLADPKAYQAQEYEAVTVPKILDYPPFTPTAARQLTTAGVAMLKKLVG